MQEEILNRINTVAIFAFFGALFINDKEFNLVCAVFATIYALCNILIKTERKPIKDAPPKSPKTR